MKKFIILTIAAILLVMTFTACSDDAPRPG